MLYKQSLKVNVIVLISIKGTDMYNDKKFIGEKIKQFRKKSNLSQAELAEKVGLSDKHIGRIEAGKYLPGFGNFLNILEVLNIDISEFGFSLNKIEDNNKKEFFKLIYSSTDKEINLYLQVIKTLKENL